MLPDRVSNPGPLTYESGALPIALRGCGKYDQTRHWSVCASSQLVWNIYIVNLWRRLKDACVERK